MWPWEHIAVGYIAYSVYLRGRYGRSPRPGAVIAVAAGSMFPDLLDKPLEWAFGLFPSISIGHSILVAIPLGTLVIAVTHFLGRADVGGGFVCSYFFHIPCDLLYPLLLGLPVHPRVFLWPLYSGPVVAETGTVSNVLLYLTEFRSFLSTPRGTMYLAFEVILLSTAALLWIDDGMPVLDSVVGWARRAV